METLITTGSIFGALMQSESNIKIAKENLLKILNNPDRRLRREDIKRAKNYLKLVQKDCKVINATLKEFEGVAA